MSYIGSKRSSSLVSFDEGTIGSDVVFPNGHVIRVETTNVTTQFIGANNTKGSWTDLTPMTVTLNNKLASSKCFICAVVNMSLRDNYPNGIRLIRRVNNADEAIGINTNTTSGIKGTASNFSLPSYGNDYAVGFPIMWMDTTSATSVTYKLQYFIPSDSILNFYFNQTLSTSPNYTVQGVSSISVMEIAQ